MSRVITAPGILKNVQGQINRLADIYDDVKDNNLKPITITLNPVTNANGAVSVTTSDERVTEDMKAIAIEVGTPESFKAPINVTTGSGTVTMTCANASGNSTVTVTFIKTSPVEGGEDYPPAVTSTEFDILADRIGSLSSLETEDKTNLVSAVNEVTGDIETLNSNIANLGVIQDLTGLSSNFGTIETAKYARVGKIISFCITMKSSVNVSAFTITGMPRAVTNFGFGGGWNADTSAPLTAVLVGTDGSITVQGTINSNNSIRLGGTYITQN